MTFEIEDGIPITPRAGGPGRGLIYPFDKLSPGQSFFVPLNHRQLAVLQKTISACACNYGKRHGAGVAFATRREIKDGIQGIRVFRLPDEDKTVVPLKRII